MISINNNNVRLIVRFSVIVALLHKDIDVLMWLFALLNTIFIFKPKSEKCLLEVHPQIYKIVDEHVTTLPEML